MIKSCGWVIPRTLCGNPAGKKPGTLNHATLWRRRLAEGDEDGFADHVIGLYVLLRLGRG